MNELTNKMNMLISKFVDANNQQGIGETSPRVFGQSQQQPQPPKPKLKYKNWCAQVERKANSMITMMPQLDALASSEEKKREKSLAALSKANSSLLEIVQLLEIISYKPSKHQQQQQQQHNELSLSGSGGMPPPPSSSTPTPNSTPPNSSSPASPSSNSSSSPPVSIQLNGSGTIYTNGVSAASPDGASNGGLISQVLNIKEKEKDKDREKDSIKSTKMITITCREVLLQLWGVICVFVDKFGSLEKDFSIFYKTMLLIAKRKEYDSAASPAIDPVTFKPWSADLLTRYRVKLYKTFSFIANTIINTPFLSLPLSQFSAKFIVVAFFRIPKVAKLLLDALTPPETEIKDISTYYPCPQNLQHLNIIGDRPDKLPFHTLLMQQESCEKEIDIIPQGWVDNIARKENLFFIFFKEWIMVCKYVLGDAVDMKTIPGYFILCYALLHEIKTHEQAIPPQQAKATPSLDAHFALINSTRNDPTVIDALIKIIFLKTCVFDLASVASTLGIVELWIKEYGVLPETFDINFFCEGVDNIIAADHHQVLIRTLNLLYNTSDSFQGSNRRALFCDLLLHKNFYQLFLHWDQPVRNAYHHILLYRMVRIKRSELYQSGFSIAEFSKLTHNNTAASNKSLSPAKYPEKDEKSDHSYNSSSRLTSSTGSISIKPRANNVTNIAGPATTHVGTPMPTSPVFSAPSGPTKKVPPPVPPRNMSMTLSAQVAIDEAKSSEQESDDLNKVDNQFNEHHPSQNQRPSTQFTRPPEFTKYSKEFSIDLELFTNIEAYIKKVSDQFRSPDLKHHEPRLSTYVAASLSEFKTYIAINNQANATPPKIIPLMHQGLTPLNFVKES